MAASPTGSAWTAAPWTCWGGPGPPQERDRQRQGPREGQRRVAAVSHGQVRYDSGVGLHRLHGVRDGLPDESDQDFSVTPRPTGIDRIRGRSALFYSASAPADTRRPRIAFKALRSGAVTIVIFPVRIPR